MLPLPVVLRCDMALSGNSAFQLGKTVALPPRQRIREPACLKENECAFAHLRGLERNEIGKKAHWVATPTRVTAKWPRITLSVVAQHLITASLAICPSLRYSKQEVSCVT